MNNLQNSPFDISAETYDSHYTVSATGIEQRKAVWQYLSKLTSVKDVLEINCGTGEDAFFLADSGCKVLATDSSTSMINQCLIKIRSAKENNLPDFRIASFEELEAQVKERKFDLVFSDFSGLNCVDPVELRDISLKLNHFLRPEGRLIIVVFGTRCLWEKIYLLYKGRIRDIKRRRSRGPVYANLSGSDVQVFYYSPAKLKKLFNGYFKFIQVKPVGLFMPPSYLNSYFIRKKFIFKILVALEKVFGQVSFLSDFADHFIIEFKKI